MGLANNMSNQYKSNDYKIVRSQCYLGVAAANFAMQEILNHGALLSHIYWAEGIPPE